MRLLSVQGSLMTRTFKFRKVRRTRKMSSVDPILIQLFGEITPL